jgi:hypothetical protein
MFALTMAGDNDKTQLQDMRVEIDGLITDIKTIHEWVDSTVMTANTRFHQLDLAGSHQDDARRHRVTTRCIEHGGH